MNVREEAYSFLCAGERLCAVMHRPDTAEPLRRGVLVVVGGPQYRVGSHRQFVLLARHLAGHGIPVMRFDYRGMGDASGAQRDFESVDEDIRTAVDFFQAHSPGLEEVVVWGLCDAASAALFYAYQDPRVAGLVLLNPWVRTEGGEAKAFLKYYYLSRLLNRDLWRKIARGEFDFFASFRSLWGMVGKSLSRPGGAAGAGAGAAVADGLDRNLALPECMAQGMERFTGPVLFILSGDDLTAGEFKDLVGASPRWQSLMQAARVARRDLAAANHTFASREWRRQVAEWTREWLGSW